MPDQVLGPGVYVEEVPSGVRTIDGVPTSITAFVGRTARGPTDDPVVLTSFADFERVHGGLWRDSALGFAVHDFFLNGGTEAVVVRLYRPDGTTPAKARLHVGAGDAGLTLEAVEEGSWGNGLRARVRAVRKPSGRSRRRGARTPFDLVVRDSATGVVEEHRNVVVAPSDHRRLVSRVLAEESRLVVATDVGRRPPPPGSATAGDSASDGLPLAASDFVGEGMETRQRGLYALDRADLFNLLVIPPHAADGSVDPSVVAAADAYCRRRRALQIVDPPATWTTVEAATTAARTGGVTGLRSENAALYFPRLRRPDPLGGDRVETFSAAGAIAGVIARIDARRGVWKSPAGLEATLDGVGEPSVVLTARGNDLLNAEGVNCVRAMPPNGVVVWGARTMAGADHLGSEWKYLSVRRTALFLEESLHRGLQWAVFEPNAEPLWSQIRSNVEGFMSTLFREGAFQGTKPSEAYVVRCGRDTTTQAELDAGVVNVLVGFAPLKPAEFVLFRVQQRVGEATP